MTITELLAKLGIADEQQADASKVVKEFLDGEYVPKSRFNEVNAEKKNLESTVADRDKQLKELKNTEGDINAFKEQIAKLQADNKAAALKSAEELKELRLSTAIQLAIGDSSNDAELVAGLVDKSKLILGDDGKVAGLNEQIKTLKETKAFLFKPEGEPKPAYDPAKGKGNPKVNPFAKDTWNLTQQAELIKSNPEQAKILATQAGTEVIF